MSAVDHYRAKTQAEILTISFRHIGRAKLDVDWLGAFIEIYKARSVTLAAKRLGLTQAYLSAVLAKLRRRFGDALFARTSRGMEPTPYASRIYPEILQCFERLSSLENTRGGFNPINAARNFRICMTDISEITVLPALVNELRKSAPHVALEAEHIAANSATRLESGEVDLAIGYMPSLEAGFYQQVLFRQGFVCLVSKDHSRIRERLTLASFSKESHLVVVTSGTGHAMLERTLARRGVHRDVALRVPSFLGVGRIVADTELVTTVPRMLGEALAVRENVNIFSAPIPIPSYSVKLHWHARFHADDGNMWLRKTIVRILETL